MWVSVDDVGGPPPLGEGVAGGWVSADAPRCFIFRLCIQPGMGQDVRVVTGELGGMENSYRRRFLPDRSAGSDHPDGSG